jgi:hypothetical protein
MLDTCTPRAVVRPGAGVSLDLHHDERLTAWLERSIPGHARLRAGAHWLVAEPFADAALEAARATFPGLLIVNADEPDPVGSGEASPATVAPPDDRAILERLPPPERSAFKNVHLFAIRAGADTVPALRAAVEHRLLCQERQGERFRDWLRQQQARRALAALAEYPDEARAFAEHCLRWEALPPAEKARRKAERAEPHRRDWLAAQAPTDRQRQYLRSLGFRGEVASRLEASEEIDRLLHARRAS